MRYVFSDSFVCEDAETAKKVAFDPRVRMRCVTLDGDTYNPSGILKGGADVNEGPSILSKVREIQRLEEEQKFSEHKLQEARNELATIQARMSEQQELKQKTELLDHQLKLLKQRCDTESKD